MDTRRKLQAGIAAGTLALAAFAWATFRPRIVGNTSTGVYHAPACAFGSKIAPERRTTLEDEDQAERMGYRPCPSCQPERRREYDQSPPDESPVAV